MSTFDGRKRTIIYFGEHAKPSDLLPCYLEIKECLHTDGFNITHLAFGTKEKRAKFIRSAKRTENKYIQRFKEDPQNAAVWEVYCVEDGVENLSTNYLIHIIVRAYKSAVFDEYVASISIDFSVVDKVNLNRYRNIIFKYMEWNNEIIFDCGNNDYPANYAINNRNEWGFKEFRVLSNISKNR